MRGQFTLQTVAEILSWRGEARGRPMGDAAGVEIAFLGIVRRNLSKDNTGCWLLFCPAQRSRKKAWQDAVVAGCAVDVIAGQKGGHGLHDAGDTLVGLVAQSLQTRILS